MWLIGTVSAAVSLSSAPTSVAVRPPVNGSIDDVILWSVRLSEDQVVNHYTYWQDEVSVMALSSMVLWYRFDDIDVCYDSSGNGNHALYSYSGNSLLFTSGEASYPPCNPNTHPRVTPRAWLHWYMNSIDSNNQVLDASGNNRNGVALGNPSVFPSENFRLSTACTPPKQTLVTGGAIYFDSPTKSVSSTQAIGISGDAEFTLMAWVKWTGSVTVWVSNIGIMSLDVSSANTLSSQGLALTIMNGQLGLDFMNDRVYSSTVISARTWYHVAASK